MSKIIERIKADPRVADISDERGYGEGFWVYTRGWCCDAPRSGHDESACLHTIHEESPSACWVAMRDLAPCDCYHCTYKQAPSEAPRSDEPCE